MTNGQQGVNVGPGSVAFAVFSHRGQRMPNHMSYLQAGAVDSQSSLVMQDVSAYKGQLFEERFAAQEGWLK